MNVADMKFEFETKARIKFGRGLTRQLNQVIRQDFPYRRLGIIVDGGVYDHCAWIPDALKACQQDFERTIVQVYREKFEPTYDFLDKLKMEFMAADNPLVDCLVGIGGGSVLDTAKGIATLVTNKGNAIQFRGFPTGLNASLPVIAVPTTAGTGSEITFNAVFIEKNEKRKLGINTKNNFPVLAILDPELIAAAPLSVTVSSGIDALVHTLESFVSKKANYLSRIYSREAFRLIINSLPRLLDNNADLELCARMQLGSSLAIIALSNTSSGPAGGLSYYLGSNFDVPHGLAGGVFLGRITTLNYQLGFRGYAELYELIDGVDKDVTTAEDRCRIVVESINGFLTRAKVPTSLRTFGVTPKDFDGFYQFATVSLKAAFDFNPVEIGNDHIEKLLREMIPL
jgi:alcohol dehydrogenase class IV